MQKETVIGTLVPTYKQPFIMTYYSGKDPSPEDFEKLIFATNEHHKALYLVMPEDMEKVFVKKYGKREKGKNLDIDHVENIKFPESIDPDFWMWIRDWGPLFVDSDLSDSNLFDKLVFLNMEMILILTKKILKKFEIQSLIFLRIKLKILKLTIVYSIFQLAI